ncbi:hypothetical protein O181_095117 [Austropuccinia psidii MF-1]|uniref:Secreted protein n=1 Tax=Austropuccinia psidii MF-1 TaxID=1389203 RepID=A0A9Q3J472_9BASI|nr:hypothetical protein [Austropuccinia psidii MF-1]
MFKYLYLAIFSFSLFWSVISVHVVCTAQYESYSLEYSSNVTCSNAVVRSYTCPFKRCTTTVGGSIAQNLVFTNCQFGTNPVKEFYPFVWPKYMYHNQRGNIEVTGQWSAKANGNRQDFQDYVNCKIDGNHKVNTVRAVCDGCSLKPERPPSKGPPGEGCEDDPGCHHRMRP